MDDMKNESYKGIDKLKYRCRYFFIQNLQTLRV